MSIWCNEYPICGRYESAILLILFPHPGAEDFQTTLRAVIAARDDLMAGFTAERDMGTEGAGSADTAARNAIDITGGHEDANHFNPEPHVLSNDARVGGTVAVHAMGEPGTLYAAQAGVASIDHATQLSDETMQIMNEKKIPAVPTFPHSPCSSISRA